VKTHAVAVEMAGARSRASMGYEDDAPKELRVTDKDPKEGVRLLLGDLVPLEELEAVLLGIEHGANSLTGMAIRALYAILEEAPERDEEGEPGVAMEDLLDAFGVRFVQSVYFYTGQHLAYAWLMADAPAELDS
jgi:hypothetical protein